MDAERLRYLHFFVLEDAHDLQRVDHRLALKMVVGNDEGGTRMLADFPDSRGPRLQFLGGVKVVVTLVGRNGFVVGEPGIVAAAVQPNVADGRGRLRGGRERTPDDRLVNVANPRAMFVQQRQRFRRVPGVVAHFNDEWIVAKTQQHRGKVRHGFLGAMKGKRELQQDRAELARRPQYVKPGPHGALVVRGGAGSGGSNVVREALPQFCGEEETRIAGDKIEPLFDIFRFERLVKRSVDFDGVEKLGKIRGFMESPRPARRINESGPVRIRPSGGADTQRVRGSSSSRFDLCLFAGECPFGNYAPLEASLLACKRWRGRDEHSGGQRSFAFAWWHGEFQWSLYFSVRAGPLYSRAE